MAKKAPLIDRIQSELNAAGGQLSFHELARRLYPDRSSHRYQSNGGPPGCYMALSAGIRRGKFVQVCGPGQAWSSRAVYARGATAIEKGEHDG